MTVPSYRYLGESTGFERVDWPWRVVEEPIPEKEALPLVGDPPKYGRRPRVQRWHEHQVRQNSSGKIFRLFLREGVEPTEDILSRFHSAIRAQDRQLPSGHTRCSACFCLFPSVLARHDGNGNKYCAECSRVREKEPA